jgi:poly(3-hydroxybutyrate) depolymerase
MYALAVAALAPLSGTWIENITLDDGSDAFVTPPVGATEARPLVVAIHGAEDHPDWACSEWRTVVDAHAFVVCPHGSPYRTAFVWTSVDQLDKRVMAAISSVRAKYGAYVDPGTVVYAGFSQGATLAPYVVARHASVFPVVALDEGAYASASAAPALKRALLACSTWNCENGFTDGARLLARGGTDVHVAKLGNLGHTMDGRAMAALHQQWKWLVRDDTRWTTWVAAH